MVCQLITMPYDRRRACRRGWQSKEMGLKVLIEEGGSSKRANKTFSRNFEDRRAHRMAWNLLTESPVKETWVRKPTGLQVERS